MPDEIDPAASPFAEVGLGPMWIPFAFNWNWGRITLADGPKVAVLKLALPSGLVGLAFPPQRDPTHPSLLDRFVAEAVSQRSGIVIAGAMGGMGGG